MIDVDWRKYDSADGLAEGLARDVESILAAALDARGRALIALPGGSTPVPVYRRLAAADLPWRRVTIIPGDERLVPAQNPLSNARLLRDSFAATAARVVPLAEQDGDFGLAGESANARLGGLDWPLDLVWLGMGEDGHTASIFPGPDLEAALDPPPGVRAIAVLPDPLPAAAPVPRVTLTKPAILETRRIAVAITGARKRELLEQALVEGASSRLPIGRVLCDSRCPVVIHWHP